MASGNQSRARIVNKKTRKLIRARTIDGYAAAVGYLSSVVGDKALASFGNDEAKELVIGMKAEKKENGDSRFGDKTICEYFKVLTQVVASAKEKGNQIYPRKWDLAHITLPMVCVREQNRPTLEQNELETILSKVKRPVYAMVAALLAGTGTELANCLHSKSESTSMRTAR